MPSLAVRFLSSIVMPRHRLNIVDKDSSQILLAIAQHFPQLTLRKLIALFELFPVLLNNLKSLAACLFQITLGFFIAAAA